MLVSFATFGRREEADRRGLAVWLAETRKAKAMQVLVEDFQAVVDQVGSSHGFPVLSTDEGAAANLARCVEEVDCSRRRFACSRTPGSGRVREAAAKVRSSVHSSRRVLISFSYNRLAFTKWTEVCLRLEQQYSLAENCRLVAEEGALPLVRSFLKLD